MGDNLIYRIGQSTVSRQEFQRTVRQLEEATEKDACVIAEDGNIDAQELTAFFDNNGDGKLTGRDTTWSVHNPLVLDAIQPILAKHGFSLPDRDDRFGVEKPSPALPEWNSPKWKNKDFVLQTVRRYRHAIALADRSLRSSHSFMLELARTNPEALYFNKYFSIERHRDVLLEGIRHHPTMRFPRVLGDIGKDREFAGIVLKAVRKDPGIFDRLHHSFQEDPQIRQAAGR